MYSPVSDKKGLWMVVSIIIISAFVCGLDAVMISMSLPAISSELSANMSMSTFIQNGYVLGCVGFLLYFAKLADGGRIRPVLLWGTFIFALSSVACAFSPNIEILSAVRWVEGVGGAMLGAIGPVLVIRMLPENMKGRGMAYVSIAAAAGTIFGAPLSGVIASSIGWRWLFVINVPICLVLIVLGLRTIPGVKERMPRPNLVSALSFTALITAATVFLQEFTVSKPDFLIVGISAVIVAVSVVVLVKTLKGPNPILNVKVLKNREFRLIVLTLVVSMMIVSATNYLIVYYLQISWGMDQLMMSCLMLLLPLAGIPCSSYFGKVCDRRGCKVPVLIALFLRLGFCIIFAIITPEWGLPAMAIGIIMAGLSYGVSGAAQFARAIHHCEEEYRVDGSSLVSIFNQTSMAIGLILYMLIINVSGINILDIDVTQITPDAMTSCFQMAAVIGIVLSIISILLALSVRNIIPSQKDGPVSVDE